MLSHPFFLSGFVLLNWELCCDLHPAVYVVAWLFSLGLLRYITFLFPDFLVRLEFRPVSNYIAPWNSKPWLFLA